MESSLEVFRKRGCGSLGLSLAVNMVVLGKQLDSMTLEAFSNQNGSVILFPVSLL